MVVVFICNIVRIGGWYELRINRVCQEHEVMGEDDADDTSAELGSAFGGTLVVVSQLRIPLSEPFIASAILLPLVSVDLEYQDGWCALKSPRIRVSSVVRRYSIEYYTYCCKNWLEECRCWK